MQALFHALDDATRRHILDHLSRGDLTAGEIAAGVSVGKPTVSHHLGLLRRARLVSSRKVGQSVVYRLEATVLDECMAWFLNLIERAHKQRPSYETPPATPPPRRLATRHPGTPVRARGGALG